MSFLLTAEVGVLVVLVRVVKMKPRRRGWERGLVSMKSVTVGRGAVGVGGRVVELGGMVSWGDRERGERGRWKWEPVFCVPAVMVGREEGGGEVMLRLRLERGGDEQ